MRDALGLLLRLQARRLAEPVRHPRAGAWVGVGLPAALALLALWAGAEAVRIDADDEYGAMLLGLLVSGAVGFQAYPLLFRPDDDGFLRRLGIPARAQFALRALRLLAFTLVVVLALMVPYAATGTLAPRPLLVALAGGTVAWGTALFALAGAARRVSDPDAPRSPWGRSIPFDPALGSAAPLVFAPLAPLVFGGFAARLAIVPALPPVAWTAGFAAVAILLAVRAAGRFAAALPRFAPRAGEMAYAPPPDTGQAGLVIGRGLASVLPPRAGAVRARDVAVVARRFRWASRLPWGVGIVCVLALLRAGESPDVQRWVAAAGAAVLALQAGAVIGLGRMERGGRRWIDRAAGLRTADRALGRWAAAFGLALALVAPVGLTWGIIVPGITGWIWPAAAAGTALVAAAASLAAAGR